MIVYIVFFETSYDHDDFVGVFSSKEKAQERIDKFHKPDRSAFYIEEHIIDEE